MTTRGLDGVRRLLVALRSEISLLLATSSASPISPEDAPSSDGDVLLFVSEAVDRAMDTVSASASYRTTVATKLYASLTALKAQVTFLRSTSREPQGTRQPSRPAEQLATESVAAGGTPGRGQLLAGIPNLARKGWREIERAEHIAGIHHDEQALLRSAAEFIADGLWRAERIIVLATEAHRRELERRLRDASVDIVSAVVRRRYIARDADEILERIMDGAAPNPTAFDNMMATLLANGGASRADTRAFSELASRLWQRGNRAGALQLERAWTDFSQKRRMSVYCGFTCDCFTDADAGGALSELCRLHARVVPPEVPSAPRPAASRQRV